MGRVVYLLARPFLWEKNLLKLIKNWLAFRALKKSAIGSLVNAIKFTRFPVIDIDPETKSILVDLGKPLCTLVFLDKDEKSYLIESTIVFDSDILNVSTFSHLAHTTITAGFGISGVVPVGNGSVKLYVGKSIDMRALGRLPEELSKIKDCINMMIGYINYRTEQLGASNLDLSMFEAIEDIETFDPQMLGEQKDFVYRTWQKFAEEIAEEAEDVAEAAEALRKISACAEFEVKNDMNLSEIGDMIKGELLWNRSLFSVDEDDKYSVN